MNGFHTNNQHRKYLNTGKYSPERYPKKVNMKNVIPVIYATFVSAWSFRITAIGMRETNNKAPTM
jgi:preprotein translocase subunit SecY